LFWLALRKTLDVGKSGTRVPDEEEGKFARPALSLDFIGRKVAGYL